MTRKKVKLAYIANDAARKATYKKRKKGLLKKVTELSTLCDVDACAIIYSSYDSQPEVHPSPLGAQRILTRFRMMPEMDKTKKMVNQEGFLRQRIAKATEQLRKQRRDNREKEVARLMFRSLTAGDEVLRELSLLELNDLGWMIDHKLKEITRRMERLGVGERKPEAEGRELRSGGDGGEGGGEAADVGDRPRPQWFVDMMMSASTQEQQNLGFGEEDGHDPILPFGH